MSTLLLVSCSAHFRTASIGLILLVFKANIFNTLACEFHICLELCSLRSPAGLKVLISSTQALSYCNYSSYNTYHTNCVLNSCVPSVFFRKFFHEDEHDRRKPLEVESGSCLQAGWVHLWFDIIPLGHLAILAYPLGPVWVLYLPRKPFPNFPGSSQPVSQNPLLC